MGRSALRRRRTKVVVKNKSSKWLPKLLVGLLGIILIIIGGGIIFWNIMPATWDGESRLAIAMHDESDIVPVIVYDPASKSVTEIRIPGDTQIEAAWQMGAWRVGSLWQLGIQEKRTGELLAKSITKSFRFPIDAWSEKSALAQFGPTSLTSLTLKDRIRLKLFMMSLKPSSYHSVELVDTNYLRSAQLNDGEEGYVITGGILPSLASYFSDPAIADSGPKIAIYDETKRKISAERVGEIIQVLGGKVYAIYEKPAASSDCTVVGEVDKAVQRIANIFDCKEKHGKPESTFDIEIYLGSEFENRF